MSIGGGPVFTFSLPGWRAALCPLSVKPLTLMCVWLSFQTKEALFAELRLTVYVNYKRLLHLIVIFHSVQIEREYSRFFNRIGVARGGHGRPKFL